MDRRILRHYERLRAKGWTANTAFRAAKIRVRFEDAENAGLVRIRVEQDDIPYEKEDIDANCPDEPKHLREKWKREEEERARHGRWGVIGEYRLSAKSQKWRHGDSVWGFAHDDLDDNGYDDDIMGETLDALAQARADRAAAHERRVQKQADKLAARATYAAGGQ